MSIPALTVALVLLGAATCVLAFLFGSNGACLLTGVPAIATAALLYLHTKADHS